MALIKRGFGARRRLRGEPRRKLQRLDQAAGIGAAGAGDIEGGAVIGRGADERQAERDIDGAVEGERLHRDQRLIVEHAERDIIAGPRLRMKKRVGGKRSEGVDAFRPQLSRPPA